jgi:hypothetical protein
VESETDEQACEQTEPTKVPTSAPIAVATAGGVPRARTQAVMTT